MSSYEVNCQLNLVIKKNNQSLGHYWGYRKLNPGKTCYLDLVKIYKILRTDLTGLPSDSTVPIINMIPWKILFVYLDGQNVYVCCNMETVWQLLVFSMLGCRHSLLRHCKIIAFLIMHSSHYNHLCQSGCVTLCFWRLPSDKEFYSRDISCFYGQPF